MRTNSMSKTLRTFSFALLLLILLAAAASAQEFRGTISGVVADATGSVIPGAKVLVTETKTGTKDETTTDSAGHYNVPFLLPGDYEISVKMGGFKEYVRKALHLGAGESPIVDAKLEVGTAQAAVEVSAMAPLINSENASIGSAISTKEIEDLPSN